MKINKVIDKSNIFLKLLSTYFETLSFIIDSNLFETIKFCKFRSLHTEFLLVILLLLQTLTIKSGLFTSPFNFIYLDSFFSCFSENIDRCINLHVYIFRLPFIR